MTLCVVVTLQGIDVDDEEESEKDLKLTFEDYDEKEIEIMLKQIHRERFENFQHHSLQLRYYRYVVSTDRSAALELLKTNPSKEAVDELQEIERRMAKVNMIRQQKQRKL